MDLKQIVESVIQNFCEEFMANPYLCYTEHGFHAAFFRKMMDALDEKDQGSCTTLSLPGRHGAGQNVRFQRVQKEYPTPGRLLLRKARRQSWDIAVFSRSPEPIPGKTPPYDFLQPFAVVEFGLNACLEHLRDDIQRVGSPSAHVEHGYVVHLERLSEGGKKAFSGRDRSLNSREHKKIDAFVKKEAAAELEMLRKPAGSHGGPMAVYYAVSCMADPGRNEIRRIPR